MESVRTQTRAPHSTSVFLQPIAAPLILGLSAFGAAAVMLGGNLAHWYGSSSTGFFLAPFLGILGIAQLAAAFFAFRARDGIATSFLGGWGSFWLGYGILQLLFATHVLAQPAAKSMELGFWYIAISGISLTATIAALGRNAALSLSLAAITLTAILAAIAQFTGNSALSIISGYGFLLSAVLAWYTSAAKMLASTYGRDVLPVGRMMTRDERELRAMFEDEPGVKRGE